MKKSFDVLIVFVLVMARIRSDTLADLVLPDRHEDVRRLVEAWWPAWSLDLLAHPETDPVSMMLIAIAVGMLATYLIVDIFAGERQIRAYRLKLVLIYGLIALLVIGKTILLINLRQIRGPASYAHDGGVIQTEVTINYFLQGLNPYVEDYVDTPMAEWGFAEYRTALYHYPYLPWTFVASTPFFLLSRGLIGWFDVRIVYLLAFVVTLALVQALVRRPQEKLIALAVVGLNPIAALSLIFGENDPFVMAWILLGLWLLQTSLVRQEKYRFWLGSAAFGLACATKPTAWFLVPFWLLYLLRDQWGDRLIPAASTWPAQFKTLLGRTWPLPVVTLLFIGPWFVWNPEAMFDDVYRWAAGQGSTGYQIWGWGASNFVLGLGWVSDRFEYWPFAIPTLLITLPLLGLLLWRQARSNTMAIMLYAYVVLLFAFFYVSRFLQPNYLGFMLGFLALAVTLEEKSESDQSHSNRRSSALNDTAG